MASVPDASNFWLLPQMHYSPLTTHNTSPQDRMPGKAMHVPVISIPTVQGSGQQFQVQGSWGAALVLLVHPVLTLTAHSEHRRFSQAGQDPVPQQLTVQQGKINTTGGNFPGEFYSGNI